MSDPGPVQCRPGSTNTPQNMTMKNEKTDEKPKRRPGRPRFLRTYDMVVIRPMRLHGPELLLPGHRFPKLGEWGCITPWRLRGLYRNGRIAEAGSDYAEYCIAEWKRRGGELAKAKSKPLREKTVFKKKVEPKPAPKKKATKKAASEE